LNNRAWEKKKKGLPLANCLHFNFIISHHPKYDLQTCFPYVILWKSLGKAKNEWKTTPWEEKLNLSLLADFF
jgi:hypothetical protein